MATLRAESVQGSEHLLKINLSAWHRRQFYSRRMISESLFCYDFAVRPVKLDFYDHPFTCPLCKEHIVYISMHTVIVSSRRKRPSCQGELLIYEGTVTAISERKPPKTALLQKG